MPDPTLLSTIFDNEADDGASSMDNKTKTALNALIAARHKAAEAFDRAYRAARARKAHEHAKYVGDIVNEAIGTLTGK